MIRHSVKVLPIVPQPIQIAIVRVNGKIQSSFNHVKRFINVKREDHMEFHILLKNMKTFENVFADGKNLCLQAFLYEEGTQDYTKEILKFKQNGGIIRPKESEKNIKIKFTLKDRKKVIDYCLVDIV